MCGPQVRFCKRCGGASPRAYSTSTSSLTASDFEDDEENDCGLAALGSTLHLGFASRPWVRSVRGAQKFVNCVLSRVSHRPRPQRVPAYVGNNANDCGLAAWGWLPW